MPRKRHLIPPTAVTGRADLDYYLGQSLLSDYYERDQGRVRQVSTSLKTYLIEAHLGSEPHVELAKFFPVVRPTQDERLYLVNDERGDAYFVDALDERLPLVHTIGHTNLTDGTLAKLTRTPGFDRAWLPSRLLLGMQVGRLIGFRFFHQRNVPGLEDSVEARELAKELGRAAAPPFRMSVSEYAHAARELELLREVLPLGRRAAIESLSWRSTPSTDGEGFIHNQVWSSGKVAAYGTSWAAHLNNVFLLRDLYRDALTSLEATSALSWDEGALKGELLEVAFEHETVLDPRELARALTYGAEPFRLLGMHIDTAEGVLVQAVDLHVGHRVDIEVTRQFLRVTLPQGTCANVVLRLLLNVERHLSAELATSFDHTLASAR